MLKIVHDSEPEPSEDAQPRPHQDFLVRLTKIYAALLLLGFALLPAPGVLYLWHFADQAALVKSPMIHAAAIAIATIEGAFIFFVAFRAQQVSGSPFQKRLMFGFGLFAVFYALHGICSTGVDSHSVTFGLFSAMSRLALAVFFVSAIMVFGNADTPVDLRKGRLWRRIALLGIATGLFVWAAEFWPDLARRLIEGIEWANLALFSACLLLMAVKQVRVPFLTRHFGIALAFLAQTSAALLVAQPWGHLWWYAHGVFGAGFTILSYGIILAYWSTKDFALVWNEDQIIEMTRISGEKAERAVRDLRALNQRLQELAAKDSLTGALNRRAFLDRANEEIARSKRLGAPLSLIFVDLDHFKLINDHFGHHAGDIVLIKTVNLTNAMIRPGDVIGRMGGEEFAILLPGADGPSAGRIANRLRQGLAQTSITLNDKEIRFTASLGVTQWNPESDCLQRWLERADKNLYRAKAEGRNRVSCAEA